MANEKRLIDANAFKGKLIRELNKTGKYTPYECGLDDAISYLDKAPTVDAVEVVHGRWVITANEEHSNYRWNVTAECSECHHSKGEIYAGFFSGFSKDLARDVALDCAKNVKLDNYCPNCGADMRERKDNV